MIAAWAKQQKHRNIKYQDHSGFTLPACSKYIRMNPGLLTALAAWVDGKPKSRSAELSPSIMTLQRQTGGAGGLGSL